MCTHTHEKVLFETFSNNSDSINNNLFATKLLDISRKSTGWEQVCCKKIWGGGNKIPTNFSPLLEVSHWIDEETFFSTRFILSLS